MKRAATAAMTALALVLLGCLVQPIAPAGKVFAAAIIHPNGTCAPPDDGDWNVSGIEECRNGAIVLHGSLTISGSLVLNNVSVYLNSSKNGEFGVVAEPGGSLRMANGSLFASASDFKYWLYAAPGSKVEISGSRVQDAGFSEEFPGPVFETGALVQNSVFSGCYDGLTLANASGARVESNLFANNSRHGIHLYNASGNIVSGNKFSGNAGQDVFLDLSNWNEMNNNSFAFDAVFSHAFACENCSGYLVPALAQVSVTVTVQPSAPVSSATLKEFVPVKWPVLDAGGGRVSEFNETHRLIEWDVSASGFASKTFTAIAPPENEAFVFSADFASVASDPREVEVFGGSESPYGNQTCPAVAAPSATSGTSENITARKQSASPEYTYNAFVSCVIGKRARGVRALSALVQCGNETGILENEIAKEALIREIQKSGQRLS